MGRQHCLGAGGACWRQAAEAEAAVHCSKISQTMNIEALNIHRYALSNERCGYQCMANCLCIVVDNSSHVDSL
jgi:hypothetical protein